MLKTLYVGGVPFSSSNESLRTLFSEAGGVESVRLATDVMTGSSRGFGLIEMVSAEAADAAITKFHGHEIDGRRLRVQRAKPAARAGGAEASPCR